MSGKYATEAERLEARRRTYRESQKRRWTRYREVCARFGLEPVRHGWTTHYAEIAHLEKCPPENVERWRTATPHQRYWLERYSMAQIHALATGLYQDEPVGESDGFGQCGICHETFRRVVSHQKWCSARCRKKANTPTRAREGWWEKAA